MLLHRGLESLKEYVVRIGVWEGMAYPMGLGTHAGTTIYEPKYD